MKQPYVLWGAEVNDHLVSELVDDFHIIVLDLHGHGQSGYRTPLTLEEMVEDYHQLVTKLNLSDVVWVGYSIGGQLGMRLALEHPETIDSLILISAFARLDPPRLREQTWQLWEMFSAGHREDIVDPALPLFFAPATQKNQPQLVERYRNKLINYKQVEGMVEAARAVFNRTDISDQIDAIKVPTVVIAGREDVGTLPAESEFIASHIPNAKLAIIDDASHLLVLERPQEVVQIVRKFLK